MGGRKCWKTPDLAQNFRKLKFFAYLVNALQFEEQTDFWKFKLNQKPLKNKRNKLQIDAPLKYN